MRVIFTIIIFFISKQLCVGQMTKDSFYYKKINEKGVKFIKIFNGQHKIFTQKIGKGKIKLLLLHGGPLNTHEYFENFPDNLKNDGIEIYYYDQLGSYYSDQPSDSSIWDVDMLIEQIEEVRKGLKLKHFYILGHSWGGMLAQLYAAKHKKHLKGLILSNTFAQIRDTAKLSTSKRTLDSNISAQVRALPEFSKYRIFLDSLSQKQKVKDTLLLKTLTALYRSKEDSIVRRNYNFRGDIRPEPLIRNGQHINRKMREQVPQVYKIMNADYLSAIEKIECPVLIIGGFYDRMYQDLYPEMKKHFIKTKARIYLCPNGSQFSMWDDSENYFREIVRFLKDIQSKSFDPDK
ncbi:MAG: alpha/beta fold hydrolase [Chitinophagaceae bacterium]|nr:alpha/beta fold hydrolase [Chitinophagaceae bacterium]